MKILLDAQALIWYAAADPRLPAKSRGLIASSENDLLISAVTAWEIIIKASSGQLSLDRPAPEYVAFYVRELQLIPLPITLEHVSGVYDLPRHHSDPFDRLLIAQAKHERLPIVSGDRALSRYDVQIIW